MDANSVSADEEGSPVRQADDVANYKASFGAGKPKVTMSAQAVCCPAGIKIRAYEDDLRAAWDNYVYQHPGGSLFHLTSWKRVIEKAFGFESRYLVAEDQGHIRGVLPLFLVDNLIQQKSLISTPFAVYGGICSSDDEASNALLRTACQIARDEGVQYLELRERRSTSYQDFLVKQLYVTFDQELPQEAERLLQRFPRDTRYMIRKAQKNGLRTLVDNERLTVFYKIYAHSVHHLGTPVFSKTFFQTLLQEFGDRCEITTVWHGAKGVAGVLSFRYRDWILPYYGGSLLEGRQLAVNNFMYWEVMKRAIENGIRFFDFGRSKLGTGSYLFKTQWNMRERALPYQFFLVRGKTMPNYSPANPRFQLAISLWRAMPFSLTERVGPLVVRLFP